MVNDEKNQTLGESAASYLAKLTPDVRKNVLAPVNNFVRWNGSDKTWDNLTAHQIENYTEQISKSDTDYTGRLEAVRTFLAYAKKQGWSKTNMSIHLKVKKSKSSTPKTKVGRPVPETINLTKEGYDKLVAEIDELKKESVVVTEEIKKAAADKDFRENAPLHAARERKGHIVGRLMELEDTLKKAAVIGEKVEEGKLMATLGSKVTLCNLSNNQLICYTIVHPTEVAPLKGKISNASPIGKSIIGRAEGEIIEILVPAGKQRYQLKKIER